MKVPSCPYCNSEDLHSEIIPYFETQSKSGRDTIIITQHCLNCGKHSEVRAELDYHPARKIKQEY